MEFPESNIVVCAPIVPVVSNPPMVVNAFVFANIVVKIWLVGPAVFRFGNVVILLAPLNIDSKSTPLDKSVGVNVVNPVQPPTKESKLVILDKSNAGIVVNPVQPTNALSAVVAVPKLIVPILVMPVQPLQA